MAATGRGPTLQDPIHRRDLGERGRREDGSDRVRGLQPRGVDRTNVVPPAGAAALGHERDVSGPSAASITSSKETFPGSGPSLYPPVGPALDSASPELVVFVHDPTERSLASVALWSAFLNGPLETVVFA
jgi:hypothetical protein